MQSNEPYIGSVRFFKNIIFLCCIFGVLIPTGLALRWRSRAKTAESLLAQNAEHKDWACTEEMMKLTKDGKALYLHCLPADINDVSCKDGEVEASVFDRYRTPLYKEASYKPYIIAAMIFLAQVKDPVRALMAMDEGKEQRKSF